MKQKLSVMLFFKTTDLEDASCACFDWLSAVTYYNDTPHENCIHDTNSKNMRKFHFFSCIKKKNNLTSFLP